MSEMRVSIDRDSCIGSGTCVQLAPESFELDDDGVATLISSSAAGETSLRTAERSCPVHAIKVNSRTHS